MRRRSLLLSHLVVIGLMTASPRGMHRFQDVTTMGTKFTTHAELATLQLWDDVVIDLVVPGGSGARSRVQKLTAKTTHYKLAAPPESFSLCMISDPHTNVTYMFTLGRQSFYISNGEDLLGFTVGAGSVVWTGSYFKAPTTSGQQEVLAQFALALGDGRPTSSHQAISLKPGVPMDFVIANATSQGVAPTISDIEFSDGILQLTLRSAVEKHDGRFWIDLNAGKLMRTIVDGKEVFRAK